MRSEMPLRQILAYRGRLDLLIRILLGSFLAAVFLFGVFDYSVPGFWFAGACFSVLDALNFVIHEAGHPLFSYFGEFMAYLGGTLFQLIVPLGFVYGFIRKGTIHSAWVALFWFGQNFVGISKYMADARARELPLFTPQLFSGRRMTEAELAKTHDWGYLFGELGLLEYDTTIATATLSVGAIVMLGAIFGLVFAVEPLVKNLCGYGKQIKSSQFENGHV